MIPAGADCSDVSDLVDDYRDAWEDLDDAQTELDNYARSAARVGGISDAEQRRIDTLTEIRDIAREDKEKYEGNALADAVYAEQDALAARTAAVNARDGTGTGMNRVNGTIDELNEAQAEYTNFVYTYTDQNGDEMTAWLGDANHDGDPDTAAIMRTSGVTVDDATSVEEQLQVARNGWTAVVNDAYDDDGNLVDNPSEAVVNAAKALAAAERKYADALHQARAEVNGLDRAKAAHKSAGDAVVAAEKVVAETHKELAKRAEGAGDSAANRLAEVRRTRQKAHDDASEDLMDEEDDLSDAQDDLTEAEDKLDDAERDLSAAQRAYDEAVEDVNDPDNVSDDEQEAIDAAALELADADRSYRAAKSEVTSEKTAVKAAQDDVDDAKEVADKAKEALDEATEGGYEYVAENPASDLVDALVKQEDTGGALVDAVDALYQGSASNAAQIAENSAAIEGLDTDAIGENTGRISNVETEIGLDENGDGTVELPDGTMGSRVDDIEAKLMLKKQYIDNLGGEMGFNAATNEGTVMLADGTMGSRIDKNAEDIVLGDNAVRAEFAAADDMVRGEFAAADDVVRGEFAAADMGLSTRINDNTASIADAMNAVGQNRNSIMENAGRIGELSEDLDIVRSGVAAAMALAGMPAINGRGVSIGVGSFDGESAFAVGFQIQGEMASFKVGVTSSGGETGASAGVGFQF